MIVSSSSDQFRDVIIIVTVICIASVILFAFLRPKAGSNYVPLTVSTKKKQPAKKKRKSKEPKLTNKEEGPKIEEDETENIPPSKEDTVAPRKHRKSIELDIVPELLEDKIAERHEPHLDQQPNRPILKNRNSVENVDLNSSGVHYDHKIRPKDEVEIFHSRLISMDKTDFKTNPGFDENLESPWETEFAKVDTEVVSKKKQKAVESQTMPLEELVKAENQINELNSKVGKLTKDLKQSNDELNKTKAHHASLNKTYLDLKTREEDVSRTCKALQHELASMVPRFTSAEKNKQEMLSRLQAAQEEIEMVKRDKNALNIDNQKLRQSINQLNGKLGVINNISNDNILLKTRLDQAENELHDLKQSSMMRQSSFSEKESAWKKERSESSMRQNAIESQLHRCRQELEVERRRADLAVKEKAQLHDECLSRDRTLEGLKEQFTALNLKQMHLDKEKSNAESRHQASINELLAQVSMLTRKLSESDESARKLKLALDEANSEQMVLVDVKSNGPSEREVALKKELDDLKQKSLFMQNELLVKSKSLSRIQQEKRDLSSQLEAYQNALMAAEQVLDLAEQLQSPALVPKEPSPVLVNGGGDVVKVELLQQTDAVAVAKKKSKKKKKSNGKKHDDTLEEGEIRDE